MAEETLKEKLTEAPRAPAESERPSETRPAQEASLEIQDQKESHAPETEKEGALEQAVDTLKSAIARRPKKSSQAVQTVRDELTVRVEKIMEEHLAEAYQALDPIKKQEFKIAGEKTAYAIRQLLTKTHVKIKKIFKLLFRWLKLLPGVNRYFLEQEAKIKTDKILSLKNRE